jgi:hypothetical protein
MKRPYEKPTLTDLSLPTARAGWLSGDGKASPQASCHGGDSAGQPYGDCSGGGSPGTTGSCHSGTTDAGKNYCVGGGGVLGG